MVRLHNAMHKCKQCSEKVEVQKSLKPAIIILLAIQYGFAACVNGERCLSGYGRLRATVC